MQHEVVSLDPKEQAIYELVQEDIREEVDRIKVILRQKGRRRARLRRAGRLLAAAYRELVGRGA